MKVIQQKNSFKIPYNSKYQKRLLIRMIDRLKQLHQIASYEQDEQGQNEFEQISKFKHRQQEGIGDQYFEEIKSVRELIAALKNNNYKMQSVKGRYAKAIKSEQEKTNSLEMNNILNQNGEFQLSIKNKLKGLKGAVEKAEASQPNEPETRMKKNFYMNLSKQASDMIQKQQAFEEEFRNAVKEKVSRQVRLIDRDITDQEIDEYVSNPDLATEMLQRKMYGQTSTIMKNTVSDIQDKFKDIVNLEASVNRCVQLFQELAVLVFAQGEMIDSIQANVGEAKDYVKKAEVKIGKAKGHHKESRKFICKVISGVVGCIMVMVIILLLL